MKEINPLQVEILQKLLYSDGLKFSQIKPKEVEGSLFTFHLDQLIKNRYIIKSIDKYELTQLGKEFANRMDLGDITVHSQAKVSVVLVCRKDINNTESLLLYTRQKAPFFGFQGFPTGKVKKGEEILKAARRELKEETGLTGLPKLLCIRHYTIFNSNSEMIEDKIFFVCKFDQPDGELVQSSEGSFEWVNRAQVWDYLKKPVPEIKEILEQIDSIEISFKESSYSTEEF